VAQSYTLVGVQAIASLGGGGSGVPVTFVDGSGRQLRFDSGSLKLEADGSYDLTVNVVFNNSSYDAGDLGTYARNGASLAFSSQLDPADNFAGTEAGSHLKAPYRVAGLMFELDLKQD
jgi:hypothetical protein